MPAPDVVLVHLLVEEGHRGARAECGIEAIGPLTSRGVLLDIAGLHGLDELPAGHAIGREDIEAAEARLDELVIVAPESDADEEDLEPADFD